MANGLNVGRLIRVDVTMSPQAAARRGFGTALIITDDDFIPAGERLRLYTSLDAVGDDAGTTSEAYKAALMYFGQSPKPRQLAIGRMVATASGAYLQGAELTSAEQALANFTGISDGSFKVSVDGTEKSISAVDLSSVTNLNGVASAIQAKLGAVGTIAFDGKAFTITSASTGSSSAVTYASPVSPAAGTDLSALLKLDAAHALPPVAASAAETPIVALQKLASMSGVWYGCAFATSATITDAEHLAIAAYIEAATPARIYGVTVTDTRAKQATYTDDLGAKLAALKYKRSCAVYSVNPYAVLSMFGRAFSVNFSANKSVITLMYKQMPGVASELLSETEAQTLAKKRYNVFAQYDNDTAILQNGVMSGPFYFDEVHGTDWLANAVQNAEWNLLYQSQTKVPQTDGGQTQLINAVVSVMHEAVDNGLVAPGTWNADGFGQLARGDFLKEGFYVYTPPMATQDQSIREQRIAPPIQVAAKLAGAVHEVDVSISVNR